MATQFPQWFAGSRITAAMLLEGLPLLVSKPTDESVTSSTVLQNDNDLVVPVVANGTYNVQMFLDYEAANGGDLKWAFTVPSGATLRATASNLSTSSVAVTWNEMTSANATFSARGNGAGAGNSLGLTFFGSLAVSGTAGNFQLQWAQNTSSATATIVHAHSYLQLLRVS